MAFTDHHGVVWDDLRVAPQSLPSIGSNSPDHVIVTNDGAATTGHAAEFNGSSDSGTVPYYADLNMADMTINVWIKPDSVSSREIIDRNMSNGWEFYITSNRLYFAPTGGTTLNSGYNSLTVGQVHMATVTVKQEGSSVRCKLYIDGQAKQESVISANLPTSGTDGLIVGEWNGGGWNYDGVMDDLQVYNVVLTDAQITELYNSGTGITGVPTGVTEATELVASFFTNPALGSLADNYCTLGAGHDMTLAYSGEVDGLVGSTTGSFGVAAISFPPGVRTEVFFSVQMPHKYKQGSDVNFHFHGIMPDNDTGAYTVGLECVWANIEEAIGNTVLMEDTTTPHAFMTHVVDNLGTLDGTGKNISSVMLCRFYRNGDAPTDTYDHPVYVTELDFHYQIDTDGSREEWVK